MRFMLYRATKPTFSMHYRLFSFFLALSYTALSLASEGSWDCKQNKATQEWLCVDDNRPATNPPPVSKQAVTNAEIAPAPKVIAPMPSVPKEQAATVSKSPATFTLKQVISPPDDETEADSKSGVATPPVATEQSTTEDESIAVFGSEQTPSPPKEVKNVAAPKASTLKSVIESEQAVTENESVPEQLALPQLPKELENSVQKNPKLTQKINEGVQTIVSATNKPRIESQANLPDTDARHPGWNCDVNDKDNNWNCNLVGADPVLQTQMLEENSGNIGLLTPAFDSWQEQIFKTLSTEFKTNPWQNCKIQRGTQRGSMLNKAQRDTSPFDVKSNYAEVFDNEIASYLGGVEMSRADQHSISNAANYDASTDNLDLHGDVFYSEDQLAVHSRTASLKMATDQAKLRDTLFIIPAPMRGSAQVVYRESKTLSRYKEVALTSCPPGNQDWVLHASELKINDETGRAGAKNTWLEFKGVPMFYSPYLSFPKDNRRLTGFLSPTWNFTESSGFSLQAPYYWNIAPNYDTTLHPRYLSKRGIALGADSRYLTENSRGRLNFEYLPHDQLFGKSRYQATLKNSALLTPHISSNLDLNYVSDKNYFADLGNALSFPNFNFVGSSADISYAREGVSLSAGMQNYQSINPLITGADLPYRKLPQILLNLNHSFNFMPLDVSSDMEMVNFQHKTLVDGQRYNIRPSLSFPLKTAAAFITPKIVVQHTQYSLKKNAPTVSSNISRTLPILSLDTGLFFERDVTLFDKPLLHTLEPRLFYLYVPRKNQSDIPIFDSGPYDFVFESLFRDNRFSGTDRVQDANQLSVALTSRFNDSATGKERLKLNIGEIFYFKDRNVTLYNNNPNYPVLTSSLSPLVTELTAAISDHIGIDTGIQWDPHYNKIVRGKAFVHYNNNGVDLFNAGYAYRRDPLFPDGPYDIIMSDISARIPIIDNWYAIGRWQYSLLYNRSQESFFGLEKENCCWRFRVIGRRYINTIVNTNSTSYNPANAPTSVNVLDSAQAQSGIFFQLELKGLTGLGLNMDNFFEQNIFGYRNQGQ